MKKFIEKIKFEYVIAILLLGVLSAALFYFNGNKDIVVPIITCLIGAFGGVIGYFFTKYTPTNQNFINNAPVIPKEIDPVNITNDIK